MAELIPIADLTGPEGEVGPPGSTVATGVSYSGGPSLPASSVEAALDTLDGRGGTQLASAVDLDTLTTPGVYLRHTGTGSTAVLNYPYDGFAGWIEVAGSGTLVHQRATYISNVVALGAQWPHVTYRTRHGGTWGPWRRFNVEGDPGGVTVGTGDPNGVISAPVGSVFRNTETGGHNGAKVWRKDTGTGATGWVVESGDTGWRNVSGLLTVDWEVASAAPAVRLRRVDNRCMVYLRVRRTAASSTGARNTVTPVLTPLPAGFAASAYAPYGAAVGGSGLAGPGAVGVMNSPNGLETFGWAAAGNWAPGNEVYALVEWETYSAWPATLPGTAV